MAAGLHKGRYRGPGAPLAIPPPRGRRHNEYMPAPPSVGMGYQGHGLSWSPSPASARPSERRRTARPARRRPRPFPTTHRMPFCLSKRPTELLVGGVVFGHQHAKWPMARAASSLRPAAPAAQPLRRPGRRDDGVEQLRLLDRLGQPAKHSRPRRPRRPRRCQRITLGVARRSSRDLAGEHEAVHSGISASSQQSVERPALLGVPTAERRPARSATRACPASEHLSEDAGWSRCRRRPARRDSGGVVGRAARRRARAARPNRADEVELAALAGSLSSQIRPPIISTSCARDGQAEPGAAVAPRGRRVGLHEGAEDLPLLVRGDADAGVAHREPQRTSSLNARPVTSRIHLAASVNLMALPTRLRMTWRRRPGSPTTASGTSGAMRQASSRPFSAARGASSRTRPPPCRAAGTARRVERQPAGLDLREVEDVVDDRQQRLGRLLGRLQVVALLAASARV